MATEIPVPVEINLHQKSHILAIRFSDGASFEYPCEYLRVFSPAAEVKASETPVTGKEQVNILKIEPQGQYAIQLVFDDDHDTGIYSWETLYALGQEKEKNWQDYLKKLEGIGYQRIENTQKERRIKIFYFSWLVNKLGKQHEEILLPDSIRNIEELLKLLSRRRPEYAPLFEKERLRPTINKQFAEFFTQLENGDEVALVPTSPTPPATPGA
ncbi:MAG: gamma-butyrobetaine hydroxylase-like domain-containing protein [Pseudomonadota bacterium]